MSFEDTIIENQLCLRIHLSFEYLKKKIRPPENDRSITKRFGHQKMVIISKFGMINLLMAVSTRFCYV